MTLLVEDSLLLGTRRLRRRFFRGCKGVRSDCGDDRRSELFHFVAVRLRNELKTTVNFRQAEFDADLSKGNDRLEP